MSTRTDLELIRLVKDYGQSLAVAGIDLKIAAGSYCCLLGPSGCGKTSTLRMIAGHEEPTEGSVVLGGREITHLSPSERGTAMMFQSYALFPHLSVLDNVAFSERMKGTARPAREARAMELLKLVHMEPYAQRLPAALSGGQQQRDDVAFLVFVMGGARHLEVAPHVTRRAAGTGVHTVGLHMGHQALHQRERAPHPLMARPQHLERLVKTGRWRGHAGERNGGVNRHASF